jgi:3'(2'), 5'-bisphosphate nucleotidase/myo-inositol-1(or 4)-monophosphatase
MKISDLCIIQEAIIPAACEAGKLIMQNLGRSFEIANKSDSPEYIEVGDSLASQVVTEVDHKSQACILKTVSPILHQYDLALLTEESSDDGSRFKKDHFICIDPLDGTLPFTEGKSGFSIAIALVSKQGIPQLGIVYDPYNEVLYSAIKGQGALRNNAPFKVKSEKGQPLTLITDRSFLTHPYYDDIMEQVNALAASQGCAGVQTITQAGAALNACWIAEKAPSLYFKYPKKALGGGSMWDFAAAACIASEAGAFVSNIYGEALDLNRKDSAFMNHEGVLFASSAQLAQAIIDSAGKFS